MNLVPKRYKDLLQCTNAIPLYCTHGVVSTLLLAVSLVNMQVTTAVWDAHTLGVVALCIWTASRGWERVASLCLLADLGVSAYMCAVGFLGTLDGEAAILQAVLALVLGHVLFNDQLPHIQGCSHSLVGTVVAFNCSWLASVTAFDPTSRNRRMLQVIEVGLIAAKMCHLSGCPAKQEEEEGEGEDQPYNLEAFRFGQTGSLSTIHSSISGLSVDLNQPVINVQRSSTTPEVAPGSPFSFSLGNSTQVQDFIHNENSLSISRVESEWIPDRETSCRSDDGDGTFSFKSRRKPTSLLNPARPLTGEASGKPVCGAAQERRNGSGLFAVCSLKQQIAGQSHPHFESMNQMLKL